MPSYSDDHHLALPMGTLLNEFRLEEILGSGGFGITYRALDTHLQRKVAIKEFFPNDLATRLASYKVAAQSPDDAGEFARQLKRFLHEATILAQLNHPNIVKVSRYLQANGTGYFVMEYLDGLNLGQYFARRSKPPAQADLLRILHPILDGLECLHSQKLLHRDLKPDNILVVGENRPVIIDLGVAKSTVRYSVTGEAFCAPGYTPFEQYQTHGNMGPWTDIYALGASLHKIITGELPPESLKRLDHDPYLPLVKRLADRYSRGFLAAIDQALAVKEKDRPVSVAKWRLSLSLPPLAPAFTPVSHAEPAAVYSISPPSLPDASAPPSPFLESIDFRYVAAASLLLLAALLLTFCLF